jgi:2'-5' RNA ligase
MTHSRKQGRSSRSACRQDVCAPGATWRVFVAIDLPAEVRRHITLHAARLREQLPEVHASWNREENIHLTLKFLGDLPLSRVEALSRATERAAGLVQPFELRVEGCGSFPPRGAPRVLWIGIDDPTGNLAQLYRALEDECAQEGFSREVRSLHPHLTVTRLRKPHGARRLAELHNQIGFERMAFVAEDLRVIRSELSPQGSRYTVIARHAFGK